MIETVHASDITGGTGGGDITGGTGPSDGDGASSDGASDDGASGDGMAPPPNPSSTPPPPPSGPRRLRALLIGSVIAIALAVFLFVGLGTSPGPGSGPGPVVGVGDQAPTFTLASVTGGPRVNLDALGRDRHHPVVLNFFASWCVPCQQESPLLARTAHAQRVKGSPVQFIGVDVADRPAQAIPFLRQAGITYPVGSDSDYNVTSVVYGLNAQPNTFFVDASGQVIGHVIGAVTQSQLDQWLHRLAGSSA